MGKTGMAENVTVRTLPERPINATGLVFANDPAGHKKQHK